MPALPDFERWPLREALRHRAVLMPDASGPAALCADRDADPLLLQAAEARLAAPVVWRRCESTVLDAWLAAAEGQGRALSGLPGADDAANSSMADASADTLANARADARGQPELSLAGLADGSSPAVRLLDAVIYDALKDGASDIHLERDAQGAQVRVRLDGVMQPLQRVQGAALAEQMVSRLKVMAELDIGERRLPQDGRFGLRSRGRDIDFRLSILPSAHGEDAVVRVLDRAALHGDNGPLTLASLGFDAGQRSAILAQARRPHGMLLVTGPTGSGKTTTLYAAIGEIHHGHEKIITIEDPVEYELPGVVQVPVNERKGLSFARGLRSMLRHDPDRVLVGEIRDAETAQIAVQAALTGHLVFSTVHANHALDVIGRFMHMGLDLYNLVAALNAVLAQRLLRRLCAVCAEPLLPDDSQRLRLAGKSEAASTPHRAVGCPACRGTGYRGRLAVAELLVLDDALRDLIVARAPLSQIKQRAREQGLRPLAEVALDLVRQGLTTLEEVDRVVAP